MALRAILQPAIARATLKSVMNDHAFALTGLAQGLRNPLCRVIVKFLNPDTVLVDLRLDVAVGRAAYSKADRAARAVARQTDDSDVMCEILASELCSETDLVSLFENLLLKLDITESTTCLITCSRKCVIVMCRSELHCKKVLLS